MVINRRTFLSFALGSAVLGHTVRVHSASRNLGLLSCHTDNHSRHFISLINLKGEFQFRKQLPARGHGLCVNHNQSRAAVFARRPGTYIWLIELDSGEIIKRIQAPKDRHYYGHGVFTADNRYLLCTENAYQQGQGVIGIYDCRNDYKRLGEMPSFGIGPHEIRLLQDDRTLVIANGGIQTHPDMPRVKLNLATMQSNLSYIDLHSQALLEQVTPPEKWHQLSMRHLDVNHENTVAAVMQYQGPLQHQPALIATHRRGQDLKLLVAPQQEQRRMKNYCGSVAFNQQGTIFAVSAPRGNFVTYWSNKGEYLYAHQQPDVCGLSACNDGFLASDGLGGVQQISRGQNFNLLQSADIHWDNHMQLVNIAKSS